MLDPFTDRLKTAIAYGKSAGRVTRDADADRLWEDVYERLKASGDTTPHTDRARPYVVRLAMLYALADGVNVVGVCHLRAALAVWDYARTSAGRIFGRTPEAEAEPDPLWLRLLNAITHAPGVSRSELLRAVREPADAVAVALGNLASSGQAHVVKGEGGSRGPKPERWYPGRLEPEASGGEPDNTPVTVADDPWTVKAEAEALGNSFPEGKDSSLNDAGQSLARNNSFPETLPASPTDRPEAGETIPSRKLFPEGSAVAACGEHPRAVPECSVNGGEGGCPAPGIGPESEDQSPDDAACVTAFLAELESVDPDAPGPDYEPWLTNFRAGMA